jgi:phosphoribosylanthranilate isomerase
MFRVKVCGLTRAKDVAACVRAGVDALGFNLSLGPRKIPVALARSLARRVPPSVLRVGLFVNEPLAFVRRASRECGFDAVQLCGDEDASYCASLGWPVLKTVPMRDRRAPDRFKTYPIAALILDRYNRKMRGGTGKTFPWGWAREAERLRLPVLLAGGLHPGNVAEAIRTARPFGVDTASGVETRPGIKDEGKIRLFAKKARDAFRRLDP